MTNAAEMQIVVELKDKASASLKNVNRSFSSTAKGITAGVAKMAAGFALLGGAAAIGGTILALKKSISVFQDFESAIANAASVTGAVGEAFDATKKNITEVSKILGETTVFSATDAANAFYDLASAGYDVANMTKADLVPILDIAAATQTDLTKATEVVTSTLGQFGLGIEGTQRIADVFAKTIGSSKATIDKLEASLRYVGPVANAMGMEIEEVNAILGHLYNAGFRGEQAGTALRAAFSRLLNPTTAMKDILDGLGITLEEINPESNDFADVLDTLTKAGMSTNDAMVLFGVEAAPAMLALLESTDGIREMEVALKDAGGTAETMATQQLDTLKGSLTLLKSAMEGLWITIGEKIEPHFRKLVDTIKNIIPSVADFAVKFIGVAFSIGKQVIPAITSLISLIYGKLKPVLVEIYSTFNNIITSIPKLIDSFMENEKAISALTSVVATAIDVFNWLYNVIKTIFKLFKKFPVIAGIITIALLAIINPVLAIISIIGMLAVAWNQNWYGIKDTILYVAGVIKNVLLTVFNSLSKIITTHVIPALVKIKEYIFKSVVPAIIKLIGFVKEKLVPKLLDFAVVVKEKVINVLQKLKDFITTKLIPAIVDFGKYVREKFSDAFDLVIVAIPVIIGWFKKLYDWLAEELPKAFNAIRKEAGDFYNKLVEWFSGLKEDLRPAIDAFEDLKKSIIIILDTIFDAFDDDTATSNFSENILGIGDIIANTLIFVLDLAVGAINKFAETIAKAADWLADHPEVIYAAADAYDSFKQIVLTVAHIIIETVKWLFESIKSFWEEHGDTIIRLATFIWDTIKSGIIVVVGAIIISVKWLFESIETFWEEHGDTIIAVASYIWDAIKTTIAIVLDTIMLIIDVFLDVLEGDWSGAWERIKEYTSKTFTKLVSLFESWKSNILPIFTGVWDSFKEKVAGWADDTWTKIKTWVSDVIQKFVDFKDSVIATVKGWYDTIVGFFDLSDVQVKWPDIPNPFEGIDWCGSIPDWVKNALGICGGTTPSAPGYEKYNVYQEPDLPPYERAAPHSKYSKHDKSHSEYDVWTQHNKSGHEKWQRVHMADGGPVDKDLDARLHEGEYVVPKAGTLVMGGSPQKNGHVQMTYNIGTVNGVDGLEKLLEKHDRELYRRLVSLV